MFSRKRSLTVVGVVLLAGAMGARAELQDWVQHLASPTALDAVFFKQVALPAGPVKSLRPSSETVPALTQAINSAPQNAELYRLRGLEAERQLDFTRAEADLRKHLELTQSKQAALLALADYHHRRLEPRKELTALLQAAALPPAGEDAFRNAREQTSWKTFERALGLARAQGEPVVEVYRAWMQRYPEDPSAYTQAFDALLAGKQYRDAEAVVTAYQAKFANDAVWPVMARASLEREQGGMDRALLAYERAYQPVMPASLVKAWFDAMGQNRSLRRFLAEQRAAVESRPQDLVPATKLFYYWQQQNNLEMARRSLLEFEQRKKATGARLNAAELRVLAKLFEETNEPVDAARFYAELYTLQGVSAADAEFGLAGVVRMLLTAPEAPIRLGAGNLSYWRDIATMDRYPGTLNGVLSLLFNTTYPASNYQGQENLSVAYFHRAKAAELMGVMDQRFPNSVERATLHAKLIEAYATHGDNDGVIRRGQQYLATFPNSPVRTQVALSIANAHARKKQTAQELAVYAAILDELGTASKGMPLGSGMAAMAGGEGENGGARAQNAARSPDYARVLDLYISRLVNAKRIPDALAVFRAQIVKNPNDPGLYARLALFLEQNKLGVELEQTYQQAMKQFDDPSWSHKLARWYLRTKRVQQFSQLTRTVSTTFKGTDLERYFQETVSQSGPIDAKLYLQLNLYAHQRFPNDLVFVRNLLEAHRNLKDTTSWESLIRRYWYFDPNLRNRFFEHLSASGKLDGELKALEGLAEPAKSDRAALQFRAEALAWRGYFEESAPLFEKLATQYSSEKDVVTRASSLFRSLGQTKEAVSLLASYSRYQPRDTAVLATLGEIHADREEFVKAKPYWDRIAAVEPGSAERYLEAATVYWDYFQYDEALRLLREGRTKLGEPTLHAFETGAILENKRQYPQAVQEYLRGATAPNQDTAAQSRLVRLARQPAHRELVESATRAVVSGTDPDLRSFGLRVAVLENQGRSAELKQLLDGLAGRTSSFELLGRIDEVASRQGFDETRVASLNRQIAITQDPVEKMRLRISLVRFLESKGDGAGARRAMDAVYRDHPQILGVVRAAVDYHWRNKATKEAVDVLEKASGIATEPYKRSLTLEAVAKATESNDVARARRILKPLLDAEPLSPQLITAMAATYSRANDVAGLRAFYTEKITAAGRTELAATLRRSIIPVLTRAGDMAAATDQYIELLNRYPDDQVLLAEAAGFVRDNKTVDRLTAFYRKAAADSPKDARWPLVLARIQSATEAPADALEAYGKVLALRPERRDLWAERAALEERLLRFSDAATTYSKLYELSYRNPEFMVKVAENRVRQGQAQQAVQALRTGFLENRAVRAQDLFEVARKLEAWGLVTEARGFADEGLAKLKAMDPEAHGDLRTYMRIATRQRNYEAAYQALGRLTDNTGKLAIAGELASTAKRYFSPEEKVGLAAFLRKVHTQEPALELAGIAGTAGLADLEAALLAEQIRKTPGPEVRYGALARLMEVQKSRMRFDELANQIEGYWKVYPNSDEKDDLLVSVADAFRLAGSYNNELRVLTLLEERNRLSGVQVARFNYLLRTQAPARLVTAAQSGSTQEVRNNAAATAIDGDDAGLAMKVVAARGAGLPPVWTKAYVALTGLHFLAAPEETQAAFAGALGSTLISDQLGKTVDRSQQLVGDNWFYYGARYGEFLKLTGKAESEDYLAAELEGRPANGDAYARLAAFYLDQREATKAQAEFEHALQFQANRPDLHVRLAELHAAAGRQAEARQQLSRALAVLSTLQDSGRVPEAYWRDARETLEAIGKQKALAALRPEVEALLRTYVRRNGIYRAEPLMQGVIAAAGSVAEGLRFVSELARSAPDPVAFLESLAGASWMEREQKAELYGRIAEVAEARVNVSRGEEREQAVAHRNRVQIDWVDALLAANRVADAARALQQYRGSMADPGFRGVEIRTAARSKALDSLLARYAELPVDVRPANETLRSAAEQLKQEGEKAASLLLLDAFYQAEMKTQYPPDSSLFLGLAEVKLEQGDATAALALLRRMTNVAASPFEPLAPAAALLERFGRTAEAIEFRTRLAQAAPWDQANQIALASLKKDQTRLMELARSPQAPYADRVIAAKSMKVSEDLGSAELNWLASSNADVTAVEKPYFAASRVEAAQRTTDPAVKFRLLRGALEIEPAAQDVRLPLFRAALAVNRNQGAVSVWATSLERTAIGQSLVQFRDPEGPEEADLRWAAADFLPMLDERAEVARELAGAYRRLNYLPAARLLLRLSQRVQPSAATATELASVEAEQAARAENQRRAPVIRTGLEQERPVRPRLKTGTQVAMVAGGAR
jgi:cellulose synthase operon protein C